jgi:glycosyl transferase family 28
VDVSVEVAVLARTMGVPVVVVAMRGDRLDPAHTLGYDLADALLAPWPATLPEPDWPRRWRDKTRHVGGFSRYDGRDRAATRPRRVAVLLGAGGTDDTMDLDAAVTATPDWTWDVLGARGRWDTDPWPTLCAAEVVVTHAGQNAVAEVAAARRPAIVVPQDRPFGEQAATAAALHRGGLAVVRSSWPRPTEWAGCLTAARDRDGSAWATWAPGDGARRAADVIEEFACAPR